ncbi:MAG: NADH-quinone oxidoreductase subunit NuoE [Candidatus Bipolaricaulota bacterium]
MVTKQSTNEDILSELDDFSEEPSSLIPILQMVQNQHGFLPQEVMVKIGNYLDIPPSKVFSVASFYAQFRFEPLGEHLVKICHGTACHVKGAEMVTDTVESELGISMGETTEDEKFTVERVACLGCCSLAPAMMIDETVYGNLTRDKIKDTLKGFRGE